MPIIKEMAMLHEAARAWTGRNRGFLVTLSHTHLNSYVTGAKVTVIYRKRMIQIYVCRPMNTYQARYEADCLGITLDTVKANLVTGYGAPDDGVRLEPVGERCES